MITYVGARMRSVARARGLSQAYLREFDVVSAVLPFRVNDYVVEQLIDWDDPLVDPMFNLTFPRREMLRSEHYKLICAALDAGDRLRLREVVAEVRKQLNPHPAGQQDANLPQTRWSGS